MNYKSQDRLRLRLNRLRKKKAAYVNVNKQKMLTLLQAHCIPPESEYQAYQAMEREVSLNQKQHHLNILEQTMQNRQLFN